MEEIRALALVAYGQNMRKLRKIAYLTWGGSLSNETTFGKLISDHRKAKGWSQKQLAAMVAKEDGEFISPQYLNDIERDRRLPSSEVILALAELLDLSADYLQILAGRMPNDLVVGKLKEADVTRLMVAFRKKISK
ncbi:MAG: helix-turn-helix transcriptional regulator [Rhodocyclaceae bacterium]|nr:helix-turn-helix transcriptional regulator [Rhodocyclaceae bacterium]